MLLSEIISEADLLIPNALATADKIVWLNAINQDFFNVVKIPKLDQVVSTASNQYPLSADIRDKNITLVFVEQLKYKSLLEDNMNPLQNMYAFDDSSHIISLFPPPYRANLTISVRYARIATTTFTSGSLGVEPDAPTEFQWTYIPALAAYYANSQDDGVKAANYEAQYKAAWNVASQSYTERTVIG